jgi:hypothetical protein
VASEPLRDLPPGSLGDVEVRLVDAHLPDGVGDVVQDVLDLSAHFLVVVHVDRAVVASVGVVGVLRAAGQVLQRRGDGLGAVDVVLAGLVARRRHRAVGLAGLVAHPHDDGFALQFGLAQPLAGRVEAVHVDVEDDAVVVLLGDPQQSTVPCLAHRPLVGRTAC